MSGFSDAHEFKEVPSEIGMNPDSDEPILWKSKRVHWEIFSRLVLTGVGPCDWEFVALAVNVAMFTKGFRLGEVAGVSIHALFHLRSSFLFL